MENHFGISDKIDREIMFPFSPHEPETKHVSEYAENIDDKQRKDLINAENYEQKNMHGGDGANQSEKF